jgi:hypothetical protein
VKTLAVLCNVVLVLFTCLVMATDGPGETLAYRLFGLLLLAVPIFTALVLVRGGRDRTSPGGLERSPLSARIAAVANCVLLVLVGWALVDQYPHPNEEGFLAFVAVIVLTPFLSVLALLRPRLRHRPA